MLLTLTKKPVNNNLVYNNAIPTCREEELRFRMWLQFVASLVLFVALLFVPGVLFYRLIGSTKTTAILLSPVFSIALVSVLGLMNGFGGIRSSALLVMGAPVLVLVVLFIVKKARQATQRSSVRLQGETRKPLLSSEGGMALLYLFCGIVAGFFLVIKPLNGPESFLSTYDNLFHYNAIRSLLESGYWSPLDTSCYLAFPEGGNPMPGGTYPEDGYYPLGWHLLVVLLMGTMGCSEALAMNVLNFTFVSVLYPLGMYALMATLFRRKSVVAAGAFCSSLCAVFLWHLLIEWPLYPNLSAFCLMPLLAACFIALLERILKMGEGKGALDQRPCLLASGVVFAGIACASIHPNSIFTVGLLLIPFLVWALCLAAVRRWNVAAGLGVAVLTCAVIALVWKLLASASAFSRVMSVVIEARQTPEEAFQGLLDFSFTEELGQPFLLYLVIIGVIALIVWRRRAWLVVSLLLAAGVYYFSASMEESALKHLLTGFWYCEPKRTGSIVGLAALPLIACGVAGIYEALALVFQKLKGQKLPRVFAVSLFAILAATLVGILVFVSPRDDAEGPSALAHMAEASEKSNETSILNADELAFIEKVTQIVGLDEIVINLPYDGSIIAYGITGCKTYYLERYGYGEPAETRESELVRTRLSEISTNEELAQALERIGSSYLMLLDVGEKPVYGFDEDQWVGITSIADDTPGFSVVLAEGPLRLYRIDAVA